MELLHFIRSHAVALPLLAKFAIAMAIISVIPRLSRQVRIPAAVGLLFSGIVVGPHGLDLFDQHRPVVAFLGELGKLLLMFSAGLEIDLVLFRKSRNKSMIFGLVTTTVPLLLGTAAGLLFNYSLVPAIVLGSLLASHTLLALPIVTKLGATKLEPVIITVGATMLSDTLSLIVFAICVPLFKSGFSPSGLAIQIAEFAIFFPLILFGLSRLGGYFLRKSGNDEDAYFVILFTMLAISSLLAVVINLPGIVGAFLAGLAINATVRDKPAKDKIEFFGNSLFIPVFFIVTGFLIDPRAFFQTITGNFPLTVAVVGALLAGKWIAAQSTGLAFGYTSAARKTMWALTLPQVAATLAATLVAFDTFNAAGQRLVDVKLINVVLVLVLTTSILGPVLTERFAPRLKA